FVELLEVLEVPVDRGETDVRNVVERLQPVHDELTDLAARDLVAARARDCILDVVHEGLDLAAADRPLRARDPDRIDDLAPVVRLRGAVALRDLQAPLLDVLVGRKAAPAVDALATPSHGAPLLTRARVDDPVLQAVAVGAAHLSAERTGSRRDRSRDLAESRARL